MSKSDTTKRVKDIRRNARRQEGINTNLPYR